MLRAGSDRRATLSQADRGIGETSIFPRAREGERKTSPAGLRDSRHDPRPTFRLSIRIAMHERDGDGAFSACPSKHETARRRKTSDTDESPGRPLFRKRVVLFAPLISLLNARRRCPERIAWVIGTELNRSRGNPISFERLARPDGLPDLRPVEIEGFRELANLFSVYKSRRLGRW